MPCLSCVSVWWCVGGESVVCAPRTEHLAPSHTISIRYTYMIDGRLVGGRGRVEVPTSNTRTRRSQSRRPPSCLRPAAHAARGAREPHTCTAHAGDVEGCNLCVAHTHHTIHTSLGVLFSWMGDCDKNTHSHQEDRLRTACLALLPPCLVLPPSLRTISARRRRSPFRSMPASSRVCRSHSCTSPTGTYRGRPQMFHVLRRSRGSLSTRASQQTLSVGARARAHTSKQRGLPRRRRTWRPIACLRMLHRVLLAPVSQSTANLDLRQTYSSSAWWSWQPGERSCRSATRSETSSRAQLLLSRSVRCAESPTFLRTAQVAPLARPYTASPTPSSPVSSANIWTMTGERCPMNRPYGVSSSRRCARPTHASTRRRMTSHTQPVR